MSASRTTELATKFARKGYRDAFLARHIKTFLANQIRSLRGAMSQAAFGRLLGKPQPVVSRLEDPDYGQVTLQTLLEIASKLDIALIVRFVSFPKFVQITNDLTQSALTPASYNQDEMNSLLLPAPEITPVKEVIQLRASSQGAISFVKQWRIGTGSTASVSTIQEHNSMKMIEPDINIESFDLEGTGGSNRTLQLVQ